MGSQELNRGCGHGDYSEHLRRGRLETAGGGVRAVRGATNNIEKQLHLH